MLGCVGGRPPKSIRMGGELGSDSLIPECDPAPELGGIRQRFRAASGALGRCQSAACLSPNLPHHTADHTRLRQH